MSNVLPDFVVQTLIFMVMFFVVAVGASVLLVVVLYTLDILQTSQAIRRNYPVIGRFRYFFEHLGSFFRQYFFAMDREEMPFNRAQRSYVYRAAKNIDTTVPFGSTRDLRPTGTVMFVNCPFPTLETDAVETSAVTIGADCQKPYTTRSLFNISAMSYGAISHVAVKALSHGAAKAGAWLNTGEGALSPFHLEGGCDIVFQIGTANYGVRDEAGQLSWFKGLATTSASQVSLANSFTPVAGVIFAILLLGESPNMAVLVGGAIIVLGIVVAQLGPLVERRVGAGRAPTTDEAVKLEGGVNFKGV